MTFQSYFCKSKEMCNLSHTQNQSVLPLAKHCIAVLTLDNVATKNTKQNCDFKHSKKEVSTAR